MTEAANTPRGHLNVAIGWDRKEGPALALSTFAAYGL